MPVYKARIDHNSMANDYASRSGTQASMINK